MIKIKYFFQFIFIIIFFLIFKILGLKLASYLSGKLFELIGPFFRSKEIIIKNIRRAFPDVDSVKLNKITLSMWNNYGRVFAEYMFIKDFSNNKLENNIIINNKDVLYEIKKKNKQVIFISGHFSNFELMAMQISKCGINLSAIYRPLNNFFLNPLMESLRKKYICKNQIKKGISGIRDLIYFLKKGHSTALMIDQRVSEGIKIKFFNEDAFTTTIPAQIVKKFKIPIVPIFIERFEGTKFKINVMNPIHFNEEETINSITTKLI